MGHQKIEVFEEIVSEKAEQVNVLVNELKKCKNNSIFAKAICDVFWGTGEDPKATEQTDSNKWPGSNKLGLILKKKSLTDMQKNEKHVNSKARSTQT